VIAAGLIWVGPAPASIRAMGLKDAAKRLMEKAGVPVVPGYHGDAQELVVLAGKANEIGYPVLIKAAAGGGGKGMRRVDDPKDFREALGAAKREAKAAFGDDRVLVEKFIANPRHIEVQVFGDTQGNLVHLYERDCSLQRRHQKVMEEAPAPAMTREVRAAMAEAAIKAAKAINYVGAGTIEFIVDGSGPLRSDGFWFMEMNTRLQVEHRVTEAVTGINLIEWQLRVALGEQLPKAQDEISLNGHAVQARIYAEDPANGFLPSTGRLHQFFFAASEHRFDTGFEQGDDVPPHYDPLLAKLIVHGDTRQAAFSTLAERLSESEIAGLRANAGFLTALAADADVVAGRVETGLIERKIALLGAEPEPEPIHVARAEVAAAGLFKPVGDGIAASPLGDPWDALRGFSLLGPRADSVAVSRNGHTYKATITADSTMAQVTLLDGASAGGTFSVMLRPRQLGPESACVWPGHVTVFTNGHALDFETSDPFSKTKGASARDGLLAPMPGTVIAVHAQAGDNVAKGAPLLVLEAMKMEHVITAPKAGVLATIVGLGAQVQKGAVLATLTDG
jgi:3-methylcrotonyl-CoA carboxylase alpha subunit